jgi:hypothetical protein
MYGLFRVSFDWYRISDLLCVSSDKERLREYYQEHANGRPLYDEEESNSDNTWRRSVDHFAILEVKEI